MKLTFNIQLRKDGADYKEKLVIDSFNGESKWHVSLKLLAYLLFIDCHPKIEESAGWHYKPDLFAQNQEGKLILWVDCGHIALRKIDSIATKVGTAAEFYILRRVKLDMDNLQAALNKRVKHSERVKLLSFDNSFVDSLASLLDSTNDIIGRNSNDHLTLIIENRLGRNELSSNIHQGDRSRD